MSIGNEIRRRRETAGITQDGLARVVCLSRSAIAQYENGYKLPSLMALDRIADALGTTAAELLAGGKNAKEGKE